MDVNKIKNELIKQKESKFKGNIYHYSQVNFAYNSNKIEGSRLTSEQTEALFDTSSFIPKSDELIKLDDLIESKNHFKLFDYMLDNVDKLLTKDMIIEMNKILKRNTSDEENPRYNVGGFKVVPNIIGVVNVINTTAPEDVEKEKHIIIAQIKEDPKNASKPDNIIEKMVGGKINKFYELNCLMQQEFCVNPDFKVEKYLESKGVNLVEFVTFERGEGLEKKEDNFADEVASMVK